MLNKKTIIQRVPAKNLYAGLVLQTGQIHRTSPDLPAPFRKQLNKKEVKGSMGCIIALGILIGVSALGLGVFFASGIAAIVVAACC